MFIVLQKNIKTVTFLTDNGWGGYKNEMMNVIEDAWIERYKTKSELIKFLDIYDLGRQYDNVKSSGFINGVVMLSCDDGGTTVSFNIIEV